MQSVFEHLMPALSLLCLLGAASAELFPVFIQVQVAIKKPTRAFLSLGYLRINSVTLSSVLIVPWFTDLFHFNFLSRGKMGQFPSCSR